MTSPQQLFFNNLAYFVQKPMLRYVTDQRVLRWMVDVQARNAYPRPPGVVDEVRILGPGLKGRWVAPEDGHHGVVLYLHGGAYTIGSSITHRWLAARIAMGCGAAALVPDYRLSPEHKFPAALDDAVASYRYLLEQGHDPAHVAVSGDSAGGNLTLALMQRLSEENLPKPAALALLSPLTDMTFESPSIARNRDRDLLVPVEWGVRARKLYADDQTPEDPLLSPLFADLSDMPPTVIHVADNEVLLADSTRLADALEGAGREVELEIFSDVPHCWQIKAGLSPEADRSVAGLAAFLESHIGP